MYYIILFLLFAVGASIGSFLNVIIYRIPRGESIVYPPSHCPYCGHKLAWYDLIPILSYLVLRGRCRYCGHPISWQYPLIEFLAGIWTVGIFHLLFSVNWFYMIEMMIFGYFAIVLTAIDVKYLLLPNRILLPMAIWEFIWSVVGFLAHVESIRQLLNRFIGSIVLLSFFLLIYYLVPDGMGEGDVKLSPIIGWFLGFPKIVPWFFIAFGMGALWGISVLIFQRFRKQNVSHVVPFGPFMLWGAVIAWFYAIPMILWYKRLFFL